MSMEKKPHKESGRISLDNLIPKVMLGRGIDDSELALAAGIRRDSDRIPSIYLFDKKHTNVIVEILQDDEEHVIDNLDYVGKTLGKPVCPFYFLGSVPANLKGLIGQQSECYAVYEVEKVPFSHCMEQEIEEKTTVRFKPQVRLRDIKPFLKK